MKALVATLTLTLTLGVTAASRADTITLTQGTIGFNFDGIDSFNLAAHGFGAAGGFTGNFLSGFTSGDFTSLSADNTVGGSFSFGSAMFGGSTSASPVWFTGFLNVHGIPFTAPNFSTPPPADGSGFAEFITGGTLTGALNGFPTSAVTGPPLFTVAFTAPGTAISTFRLLPNANGSTEFVGGAAGNGTFAVDPAPSPTPEPASIVLLGGGLALGFMLVRRRRDSEAV